MNPLNPHDTTELPASPAPAPEAPAPVALDQVMAAIHRAGGRRGMTLIEIMVVVGIMAIIGTALAFGFIGIFSDSQGDAANMQLQTISQGLDAYYVRHREYPDRLEVLVEAGMLEEKQLEDPWKKPIVFNLTSANTYELCSGGEDLAVGGQDDICKKREKKGGR